MIKTPSFYNEGVFAFYSIYLLNSKMSQDRGSEKKFQSLSCLDVFICYSYIINNFIT